MTNIKGATPLKVALVNLDNTTQKTFQFFINSNLCKNANLATDNMIDLYVLDVDREYDKQFLMGLKGGKQYVIILQMEEIEIQLHENILQLKKPINVTTLVNLINKTHSVLYNYIEKIIEIEKKSSLQSVKKLDSQHSQLYQAVSNKEVNSSEEVHLRYKAQKYVGSNKDISLEERNSEKIFLTKDRYLFYYLQKARELGFRNKSNIIISLASNVFLYNYKNKQFLFDLDDNQLKYLQTSMIISDTKLQVVNYDAFKNSPNCKNENDEEFIWNSTIQASKGRVSKGINITSTVKMTTWPNFGKLQVFRYAVQICALWSNYKLSLYETAKQLKIPQRYVFTLFSAMNALGYAEIDISNNLSHQVNTKPKNQSLFSKIISHILKN